mmetsp:Transcript_6279/g.16049  ORF Transcript_6279/g.16049 Transcript_6279/m.16049 type:complete len:350 (+) Transcript_6279:157-1206(+)
MDCPMQTPKQNLSRPPRIEGSSGSCSERAHHPAVAAGSRGPLWGAHHVIKGRKVAMLALVKARESVVLVTARCIKEHKLARDVAPRSVGGCLRRVRCGKGGTTVPGPVVGHGYVAPLHREGGRGGLLGLDRHAQAAVRRRRPEGTPALLRNVDDAVVHRDGAGAGPACVADGAARRGDDGHGGADGAGWRSDGGRIDARAERKRRTASSCWLTVAVLGPLPHSPHVAPPRHGKATAPLELVILRLQGREAPRQDLVLALQGLKSALELLNVGPRMLPRALGRQAVLDHPHARLDRLLVHLAPLAGRVDAPLLEQYELLELPLEGVVLLHRPPHLGLGPSGLCLGLDTPS